MMPIEHRCGHQVNYSYRNPVFRRMVARGLHWAPWKQDGLGDSSGRDLDAVLNGIYSPVRFCLYSMCTPSLELLFNRSIYHRMRYEYSKGTAVVKFSSPHTGSKFHLPAWSRILIQLAD